MTSSPELTAGEPFLRSAEAFAPLLALVLALLLAGEIPAHPIDVGG